MKYFRHVIIAILILIYLAGCRHFNTEVREACTHGNCVHGWYSEFNDKEKFQANLWGIGFFMVIGATYFFLFNLPTGTSTVNSTSSVLPRNTISSRTTSYDNGEIYSGQMLSGQRHGHGRYVWSSGKSYEGDWQHNQITGTGKFFFKSGNALEGNFINGQCMENNSYTWKNGNIYIGPFYEDNHELFGPGECVFKILRVDKTSGKKSYLTINTYIKEMYNQAEIQVFMHVEADSYITNNPNTQYTFPCLQNGGF